MGFWRRYRIHPTRKLALLAVGRLVGQFGTAQLAPASDTQIPTSINGRDHIQEFRVGIGNEEERGTTVSVTIGSGGDFDIHLSERLHRLNLFGGTRG